MAVGTKELSPTELDTFEDERLVDELKKAKEELFNLRFQSATGQLESHGRRQGRSSATSPASTRSSVSASSASVPLPHRSRLRPRPEKKTKKAKAEAEAPAEAAETKEA
jgi:large subunit ribosomal protein L29